MERCREMRDGTGEGIRSVICVCVWMVMRYCDSCVNVGHFALTTVFSETTDGTECVKKQQQQKPKHPNNFRRTYILLYAQTQSG